jgi:ABC-type phosphate transport system substrate-binding protein
MGHSRRTMTMQTEPAVRRRGSRSGPRWWSGALPLLLTLLTLLTTPVRADDTVEVITHSDRAGILIERPLLRSIFTMRIRQWPDGTPTRVFVLADDSSVHDRFCREQLGTYPYVLRQTWDRLVYTGTGFAPTQVRSEEEMRQRVLVTPGAIGYLGPAPAGATPPSQKAGNP